MPEQLQKNFALDIQQKLYEKDTVSGNIAVYQTARFGMMLTVNGQVILSEYDSYFLHEMMTHSALFTHAQPERVAIIGNSYGIVDEVLKHSNVLEIVCINNNKHIEEAALQYFPQQMHQDPRVSYVELDSLQWLAQIESSSFDIIIQTDQNPDYLEEHFKSYYHALRDTGILVQHCPNIFSNLHALKPIYQNVQHAGFKELQLLNFPQPSHPRGWRTMLMASKHVTFSRIREKDIFNRSFKTYFYNYDIHKAALALPEFAKIELEV